MKYFQLFSIILFPICSTAQDCTKELLAQKPGTWKAGMKGQIVNVKPADLVKEKAVIASIHKMITAKYKPAGCQITYASVFGKGLNAASNWIADPYYYSMYILRYLCDEQSKDKSKYYVDAATPTTVNITANVIYSLNNLYAANFAPDDFRGYLKLTKRPVNKDGYYFMGEEKVDYNSPIFEYRWLITYNDTLPFSYISRKEYLLIQKKRLEKMVQESPGEKAYLDQYFKNINAYLAKPESFLNEPAICMWNEEERFEKFVDEGTNGSFLAIKPNLAYYRKNLSMSSPQFFTVVYKISKNDPVFEKNMEAIKETIDFAVFKNMLGKK
ncbi:MAG TPA: hypothetical protein PK275_06330 [Chitinophagaceae bacterium]|jgi:hypothetical protein|nr:hypothetical protein [Chitinophagaceae bacterium]